MVTGPTQRSGRERPSGRPRWRPLDQVTIFQTTAASLFLSKLSCVVLSRLFWVASTISPLLFSFNLTFIFCVCVCVVLEPPVLLPFCLSVPRLVRRFPSESHKYPGAGRALQETGAPIGGISISVVHSFFFFLCVCLFCFVSSLTFPFKKVEFVFSKRIFWRLIGLPPGVIKQLVSFFFFLNKKCESSCAFYWASSN